MPDHISIVNHTSNHITQGNKMFGSTAVHYWTVNMLSPSTFFVAALCCGFVLCTNQGNILPISRAVLRTANADVQPRPVILLPTVPGRTANGDPALLYSNFVKYGSLLLIYTGPSSHLHSDCWTLSLTPWELRALGLFVKITRCMTILIYM